MGLSEGFKQNLEQADKTLDNNENNDINSGELNYSTAIKKIEYQYKNIDSFLLTEIDDKGNLTKNGEYLKLLRKDLDNFIELTNNELKIDGTKLFTDIARDLNNHWDGVFEQDISKIDVKEELNKFTFLEVKTGDTISQLIEKKYDITKYSEIESIITQLYLKNPDKVKPGEILILLKPLKQKLERGESVSNDELKDFFDDLKLDIKYLKIEEIVPSEAYIGIFNYLDNGEYSIDYKKLESLKNLEKVKKVLEETYKNLTNEYSEEEIKTIFPEGCESKENRLDYISNVILKKSQKFLSTMNIVTFLYGDESNDYSKAKKDYIEEQKGEKSFYDKAIDLFGDSDKKKFELQKLKIDAIKEIGNTIQKGMSNNFGKQTRVSAEEINLYLSKNIKNSKYWTGKEGKIHNVFDEVMKENQIAEIISSLTQPELTPKEIKSIELNFVNIMSNELRSWSSLFKNTIKNINKNDLQKLLPENFNQEIKKEYTILLKNRDIFITYDEFKNQKIKKYFEKMEVGEMKDKSRISNYVENELLSKKTDILKVETNKVLEEALKSPKQKELFEELQNIGEKELKNILGKHGLDFKDFENEFNDNIKNIFLGNIGSFRDKIKGQKNGYTKMVFQDFLGSSKYTLDFKRPVQKLVRNIENGLKLLNNEREILKQLNENDLIQIQNITVKGILEKTYIHGSIDSISKFRQSYLGENESDIKKDLENKIFKDSIKAEKDLFNTYSNITDSFNETFVINDNNTETIVNGAIFLATSFASAGLGGLAKLASIKHGTTLQTIAEVSAFSAGNLSYKNLVKGGLDKKDYLFTIMMGGAITSATKLKGLVGKTTETGFVAGAYGGDPQRILQHFLKTKAANKAQYGVGNSTTAGSLTNAA